MTKHCHVTTPARPNAITSQHHHGTTPSWHNTITPQHHHNKRTSPRHYTIFTKEITILRIVWHNATTIQCHQDTTQLFKAMFFLFFSYYILLHYLSYTTWLGYVRVGHHRWAGYQKALERSKSVPRPKGFCEGNKVKLSAVLSQNPKCRDLLLIDILIFLKIKIFMGLFGKLWVGKWEALPPCERPGLPVRGPASLWKTHPLWLILRTYADNYELFYTTTQHHGHHPPWLGYHRVGWPSAITKA